MKHTFSELMNLYKRGELKGVKLKQLKEEVDEKSEHKKQRHFQTKDGKFIDLVAIKKEALDNPDLFLVKLNPYASRKEQTWQGSI